MFIKESAGALGLIQKIKEKTLKPRRKVEDVAGKQPKIKSTFPIEGVKNIIVGRK